MEGVARRRRDAGLPAVAIGWGPIVDVGAASTNERARSNLEQLNFAKGMRASEALELLGQVLALPANGVDLPVMTVSPSQGGIHKDRLPVLSSPTYGNFVTSQGGDLDGDRLDIEALLATEEIETVREKLLHLVLVKLGKVLNARPEDISRVRPLGEIGLDSLMTLELVMDLEKSIGFNISMVNSVGTLSVPALVDRVIAQLSSERNEPEPEAQLRASA